MMFKSLADAKEAMRRMLNAKRQKLAELDDIRIAQQKTEKDRHKYNTLRYIKIAARRRKGGDTKGAQLYRDLAARSRKKAFAAESMQEKMSPRNLAIYQNKFNDLRFKASRARVKSGLYSKLPATERKKHAELAAKYDQKREHMRKRLLQRQAAIAKKKKNESVNEAYCPRCDKEMSSYLWREKGFHMCPSCGSNLSTSRESHKAAVKAKPWQHGTPRKTVKEYMSKYKLAKYAQTVNKHIDAGNRDKAAHVTKRLVQRQRAKHNVMMSGNLKEYMSKGKVDLYADYAKDMRNRPNKEDQRKGKHMIRRLRQRANVIKTRHLKKFGDVETQLNIR
jgi:hypothetical protein